MARSLGRGIIGYDQRTGRKVRAERLVEDGEHPGLIVDRDEADKEHPQKYARRIPADRIFVRRMIPERSSEPVTINVGYEVRSNLWEGRGQPCQLTFGYVEVMLVAQVAYLISRDGAFLVSSDGSYLIA